MKYILYSLILGAGLVACSSVCKIGVYGSGETIEAQGDARPNKIDSLIAPYSDQMNSEMNGVIAKAESDFVKGRPNGALNNWAADALLVSETKNIRLDRPVMCLINVGGLRNTLNEGDITLGDMFKVMPFDNEVVWVEMPVEALNEMSSYLVNKGGEPIAGAVLENGNLKVNGMNENHTSFWVITSDYLMNGGDNMTFFEKGVSKKHTGKLMRDVMIDEAKGQGTLIWSDEKRIRL